MPHCALSYIIGPREAIISKPEAADLDFLFEAGRQPNGRTDTAADKHPPALKCIAL